MDQHHSHQTIALGVFLDIGYHYRYKYIYILSRLPERQKLYLQKELNMYGGRKGLSDLEPLAHAILPPHFGLAPHAAVHAFAVPV